jgi:hypothetical protein
MLHLAGERIALLSGSERERAVRVAHIRTVLLLLGMASAVSSFAAEVAHARSGTCISLERRLTSLRPARNASRYAHYDEAVREQERQIDRANHMAWRLGCADGPLYGAEPSRRCDELDATLARMHANLAALRDERDRLGRSGDILRRQRLEAALEAHGCYAEDEPPAPLAGDGQAGRSSTSLGNQWFPEDTGDTSESDDEEPVGSGMISILPDIPDGRYRTLCVRTCDGYYFPISFGTTPEEFMRDQNACQARCPGAKVELYFTKPDEEPEKMVSLTGEPYTALPNAFKYRKSGVTPSCSCHVQTRANSDYSVLGNGSVPAPGDTGGSSTLTVPASRPGTPDIIEQSAPAEPDAGKQGAADNAQKPDEKKTDRKIRVVGPRFLPAPSKAIDLRDPDRKNDR